MAAAQASSKNTSYNITFVKRDDDTDRGVVCALSGALSHQLGVFLDLDLPYPVEKFASPAYEIREISRQKGKGMFATRTLDAGDLVLDERALMMIPLDAVKNTDFMRCVFGMLSKEDQRAFLSLHNHYKGAKPQDLLSNIVQTNGWTLELTDPSDPEVTYAAMLKDISRVNHDCSPNTVRTWSSKTLSMQLRASRTISAGEEITSFYILPLWPSARRKAHLLEHYGFACQCAACTNPLSDIRRAWLQATDEPTVLKSKSRGESFKATTLKFIETLEAEGLECAPMYPRLLYQITAIFLVSHDMRAVEFGKKLYARKKAGNLEPAKYKRYAELKTREDIIRLDIQLKAENI